MRIFTNIFHPQFLPDKIFFDLGIAKNTLYIQRMHQNAMSFINDIYELKKKKQ